MYDVSIKFNFFFLSLDAVVQPTLFPLAQCEPDSDGLITYACVATGFFPASATFQWTKNGQNVLDFVQYPSAKNESETKYSKVSQIKVNINDMGSQQDIRCKVQLLNESTEQTLPVIGSSSIFFMKIF